MDKLKAVIKVEEYEALDESLQTRYKQNQKGDAWVLEVDGIDDHPVVKGLATTLRKFKEIAPDATALKALKDGHEQLQTSLTELQETWVDLDPDETREALKLYEELKKGDGKVDVQAQIEAATGVLERKHSKVLGAKEQEATNLKAQLQELEYVIQNLVIEQELDAGLTHIKAIPELRPGAKALLQARYRPLVVRVEDENTGKIEFKGIVRTELGESSIADFFERWQTEDEAMPYLPASGNAGTGSRTGDSPGGGRKTNPWGKDTWNVTEQGRIVRENPGLAKTMAASAGKPLVLP